MTKNITIILSITFILFSAYTNAQTTYKVNTNSTQISWKGFKPTGEHYGTISLKSGSFIVNNGEIVGGNFTIDMNSIKNDDLDASSKWNAKLVNHLKSEDFFDVEKYPTVIFKITNIENKGDKTLIQGDLTIKNKTNPIEFTALVKIDKNQLIFNSETFKIDRSRWDIKYKSKSFFNNLADKFIYDEMEISITIQALK
ncbi:MAG: YceI family protein [Flavobacteriaceae bacterium]|nr:YceI family protein [Flavobacteriaceae bacterium]